MQPIYTCKICIMKHFKLAELLPFVQLSAVHILHRTFMLHLGFGLYRGVMFKMTSMLLWAAYLNQRDPNQLRKIFYLISFGFNVFVNAYEC